MAMQEIPRSTKYFDFVVMSTAIMAIILVAISFFILTGTRNILGVDMTTFGWLVRFSIILLAIGVVFTTKQLQHAKRYFFDGNKIIVKQQTSGIFANEETQIISLDPQKISSVTLNQSSTDKRYNVGTIVIEIDSRSEKHSIALEHLDNPQAVLESINSYINSNEPSQAS